MCCISTSKEQVSEEDKRLYRVAFKQAKDEAQIWDCWGLWEVVTVQNHFKKNIGFASHDLSVRKQKEVLMSLLVSFEQAMLLI